MVEAVKGNVVPAPCLPKVIEAWEEPRHEEFQPRTAWSLFNAFTVANAFRRACSGRLGELGWRRLGELLVRDFRGGSAVHYLVLGGERPTSVGYMPYAAVAKQLEAQARLWEVRP